MLLRCSLFNHSHPDKECNEFNQPHGVLDPQLLLKVKISSILQTSMLAFPPFYSLPLLTNLHIARALRDASRPLQRLFDRSCTLKKDCRRIPDLRCCYTRHSQPHRDSNICRKRPGLCCQSHWLVSTGHIGHLWAQRIQITKITRHMFSYDLWSKIIQLFGGKSSFFSN